MEREKGNESTASGALNARLKERACSTANVISLDEAGGMSNLARDFGGAVRGRAAAG